MKIIKKILYFFRNLLDSYIPMIFFILMFSLFVLQIIFRYFIKLPISWATEMISVSYIWMILMGTCLTHRKESHIVFPLIYDVLPKHWQALCRLLRNVFLIISFIILLFPTVKQAKFYAFRKTPMLQLSFDILYIPFFIFLGLVSVYSLIDIVNDFLFFNALIKSSNKPNKFEPKP